MKFASKGEVLSFLHTSARVRGMFKSTTGKMTTDSGQRQRVVARTHPTPMPVDTRLRIVGTLTPSSTMLGDFQPPPEDSRVICSSTAASAWLGDRTNRASRR